MAENKPQVVTATLKAGKLIVPVKNIETENYALRIFPEKSTQEMLYRSTRLMNLKQSPEGFECDAMQEAADQTFEIKNVKKNVVVVTGTIKQQSEVSGQQSTANPKDKEAGKEEKK